MDTETTAVSLSLLPPELLLRILSSLSTYDKLCVRLTCRRLYSYIGSDPSLWTSVVWHYSARNKTGLTCALKLARSSLEKVEVYVASHTFPISTLSSLLAPCHSLQSVVLNLGNAAVRHEKLKKFLLSLKPNTSLSLYAKRETLDNFYSSTLSKYMRDDFIEFQSLEISTHFDPTQWAMKGFCPPCLNMYCSQLCQIDMFNIHKIQQLTKKCHHRTKLYLNLYKQQNFCLFSKLPKMEFTIYPSCKHTVSLVPLKLPLCNGIYLALSTDNFDDETYSNAVWSYFHCQLSLSSAAVLLHENFTVFSAGISFLYFKECLFLESKHLATLANECPNMVQIHLDGCNNCLKDLDGLGAIAWKCVRLSEVSLQGIHRPNVNSTTKLWEILSQMPWLRVLALSNCLVKPDVDCLPEEVNDQSFERFQQCTEKMFCLTHLELNAGFCHKICGADAEFRLLTKLSGIKYLKLMDVPRVSFSGLPEFLLSLQNLKVFFFLTAYSCYPLTLPSLPSVYRNLEQLYIRSDCHAGDDFIDALVPNSSLVYVDLVGLYLSEKAVLNLVKQCPKLVNCNICNIVNKGKKWIRQIALLESLGIGYVDENTFTRPLSHW